MLLFHNIELNDSFLQRCKDLFQRDSKRSTDTKVMALLHEHDLAFASFRYALGLEVSPLCSVCMIKDNSLHQVLECPKFNCIYRKILVNLGKFNSLAEGILLYATSAQIESFRSIAQIIDT